jgi:hypothetical protein
LVHVGSEIVGVDGGENLVGGLVAVEAGRNDFASAIGEIVGSDGVGGVDQLSE